MSDKISVRIGVKSIVPLFANAGIVVVRVTEAQYRELDAAVNTIREILALCGQRINLVCERK